MSVLLALVAETSAELAVRRDAARTAQDQRDRAIRRAVDAGAPLSSVAAAAGITRQSVHLVVHAPSRRRRERDPGLERGGDLGMLSRRSRSALALAQEEARGAGVSEVAPAHLLLGLLREGVAIRVHDPRGVERPGPSEDAMRRSIERLRAHIRRSGGGPGVEIAPGRLPYTAAAAGALETALAEALALGHRRIEPEHLMIALAQDPSPVVTQLFTGLGADLASLRRAALARFVASSGPAAATSAARRTGHAEPAPEGLRKPTR